MKRWPKISSVLRFFRISLDALAIITLRVRAMQAYIDPDHTRREIAIVDGDAVGGAWGEFVLTGFYCASWFSSMIRAEPDGEYAATN